MTKVNLWYIGGEEIRISPTNRFKLVTQTLLMLNLIYPDIFDKELGQHELAVTNIQVKGETSVQKKHISM